jgi:hypothetical protein
MKLLNWIKSLFIEVSYQDNIEQFVLSKNPTTTAEVEYWIRKYDTKEKGWVL